MASDPVVTTAFVCPVTTNPYRTRIGTLSPVTANGYIGAAAVFPFFVDPYMPGTGSRWPMGNGMPYWPYRYINLR